LERLLVDPDDVFWSSTTRARPSSGPTSSPGLDSSASSSSRTTGIRGRSPSWQPASTAAARSRPHFARPRSVTRSSAPNRGSPRWKRCARPSTGSSRRSMSRRFGLPCCREPGPTQARSGATGVSATPPGERRAPRRRHFARPRARGRPRRTGRGPLRDDPPLQGHGARGRRAGRAPDLGRAPRRTALRRPDSRHDRAGGHRAARAGGAVG